MFIGQAIDGGELLAGDLLAEVEHGIEGLAAVLGVALALAQGFGLEPVVQQEVNGGAVGHGGVLTSDRPQPVKPLPSAASLANSGAGVQNWGSPLGLAAKPFISSITLGRPSMSA